MGNKSVRSRNYISFYIATGCIIAAVTLAACTQVQDRIAVIRAHHQLQQYRENLAEGFFETVIEKSMQVIEENETKPPADSAFYALGEVYAHHDYQGRDYSLSQHYFEKLIEHFPGSDLSSEAKTYISLFKTIKAKEKEAADKKKKILSAFSPGKVVDGRDFQKAVKRNQQVLKKFGNKKPADEALYNLGLIYAHRDNPAKNYKTSQSYFHILIKEFPDSEFTEEAQVIQGLFETIKKIQQIDIDIEQQKKQLIR